VRDGKPDHRRSLGQRGEQLAVAHLERLGYAALARNVRTRYGELDIIAFNGRILVFSEVKTRRVRASASRSSFAHQPLLGLGRAQRIRQRRLASAWLTDPHTPRLHAESIRFDAIGVSVDHEGRLLSIEHIEGAW
jgi:putative endonuclease